MTNYHVGKRPRALNISWIAQTRRATDASSGQARLPSANGLAEFPDFIEHRASPTAVNTLLDISPFGSPRSGGTRSPSHIEYGGSERPDSPSPLPALPSSPPAIPDADKARLETELVALPRPTHDTETTEISPLIITYGKEDIAAVLKVPVS